ncbi:MAG TPA: NAD(P)-dependent oxidoreductase, partial [Streptosporangiaceae bacterium]|nr:NAD(P)-dependent oxidoreductase [Streptosporangiaceae bacterium]
AVMQPGSWLVNVARGRHVDTGALVAALRAGAIGGAALDVTDPEPLPAGHPLWDLDRCIITPHTADTPQMAARLLSRRIQDNVARFAAGEPLIGLVDPTAGY